MRRIAVGTCRTTNEDGNVIDAKNIALIQDGEDIAMNIGPTWRGTVYGSMRMAGRSPSSGVTALDLLVASYISLKVERVNVATLTALESAMYEVLKQRPEYMTDVPDEDPRARLEWLLKSVQHQL